MGTATIVSKKVWYNLAYHAARPLRSATTLSRMNDGSLTAIIPGGSKNVVSGMTTVFCGVISFFCSIVSSNLFRAHLRP